MSADETVQSSEFVAHILAVHRSVPDGCTCGDIYPDEPFDGHLSALIENAAEEREQALRIAFADALAEVIDAEYIQVRDGGYGHDEGDVWTAVPEAALRAIEDRLRPGGEDRG